MAMGRVSGCGPASDSGGALRLLALRFPLRIGLRPMEVNTPLRFPQGLHELAVTVSDGGLFNFFFGNQFHYPLHGEKARFGLKAAARPVSNSGEE